MSEYEPLDEDSQSSLIIKRQFTQEIPFSSVILIKANDENFCIPNISSTNASETKDQPLVIISNNESKIKNFLTKKRDTVEISNKFSKSETKKRKYEKDNVLLKIQVHYMTFIIKFINHILEKLNYDKKLRFKDIKHSYKKNIQTKYFQTLKYKKLYEIIINKISTKNRKDNEDYNRILYEKIKNDEFINNILNENYLTLFRNIYYKSERIIYLKKYGKDVIVNLSDDIKMYKDIEKADKNYINIMDNYVKKNYFSNINFFQIKKIEN